MVERIKKYCRVIKCIVVLLSVLLCINHYVDATTLLIGSPGVKKSQQYSITISSGSSTGSAQLFVGNTNNMLAHLAGVSGDSIAHTGYAYIDPPYVKVLLAEAAQNNITAQVTVTEMTTGATTRFPWPDLWVPFETFSNHRFYPIANSSRYHQVTLYGNDTDLGITHASNGIFGKYVSLDGVDGTGTRSMLRLLANDSINYYNTIHPESPFSAAMWIKFRYFSTDIKGNPIMYFYPYAYLFSSNIASFGISYDSVSTPKKLRSFSDLSFSLDLSSALELHTWYFFAFAVSGTASNYKITCYMATPSDTTITNLGSATITASSNPMQWFGATYEAKQTYLGATLWTTDYQFIRSHLDIDNFMMWNSYALTEQDANQLFKWQLSYQP